METDPDRASGIDEVPGGTPIARTYLFPGLYEETVEFGLDINTIMALHPSGRKWQ